MKKKDNALLEAEKLVAKMTLEEAASQLCYQSPPIERLGIPAYNWWNEALNPHSCFHRSHLCHPIPFAHAQQLFYIDYSICGVFAGNGHPDMHRVYE